MKNIVTWLTVGVFAAATSVACSVTVGDADAGATGGSGGTGATGGAGGATGGAGGTAGVDAGTGGTAGSAAGAAGAGGAAGSDGGMTCTGNPNTDGKCSYCGFSKCAADHCACNAITSCRTPMVAFYTCMAMPNANSVNCASTFIVNANPDSSGGALANDLAECVLDECEDTCQGRDASTLRRDRAETHRLIQERTQQH